MKDGPFQTAKIIEIGSLRLYLKIERESLWVLQLHDIMMEQRGKARLNQLKPHTVIGERHQGS